MKKNYRLTRWYYRFPGSFYATGPTALYCSSERAVREYLRGFLDMKRLPRGMEIWRAA